MIVYISGKMTGLPDKGRGLFHATADRLRARGFAVIDPAALPDDLPATAYMPICLAMLAQADAILLLPGWEDSAGALVEKAFAEYQQKEILVMGPDKTMDSASYVTADAVTPANQKPNRNQKENNV